tara:strand:- start:193 stop:513 length:321 start_codon:yes stop_codon:yes gene_type:complete
MAKIQRRRGKTTIKLKENESALIFTSDNIHILYANHIGKLIEQMQSCESESDAMRLMESNGNLYDHLAARMFFEAQLQMSEMSGSPPDMNRQWVNYLDYNDDIKEN